MMYEFLSHGWLPVWSCVLFVVFQLLCPKSLIYETADEKVNSLLFLGSAFNVCCWLGWNLSCRLNLTHGRFWINFCFLVLDFFLYFKLHPAPTCEFSTSFLITLHEHKCGEKWQYGIDAKVKDSFSALIRNIWQCDLSEWTAYISGETPVWSTLSLCAVVLPWRIHVFPIWLHFDADSDKLGWRILNYRHSWLRYFFTKCHFCNYGLTVTTRFLANIGWLGSRWQGTKQKLCLASRFFSTWQRVQYSQS